MILLSPILPQSRGGSWHRLSVKPQSDIQLIRGERNENTWSFRVQKHAGEDEEGCTIPGCAKGICDTHFHISSRESPSFGPVEGCGIKIFPVNLNYMPATYFHATVILWMTRGNWSKPTECSVRSTDYGYRFQI